jgi:hypothetical protein
VWWFDFVAKGTWSGYIGYVETRQLVASPLSRLPKPTHSVVVQYTHVLPDKPGTTQLVVSLC